MEAPLATASAITKQAEDTAGKRVVVTPLGVTVVRNPVKDFEKQVEVTTEKQVEAAPLVTTVIGFRCPSNAASSWRAKLALEGTQLFVAMLCCRGRLLSKGRRSEGRFMVSTPKAS